MNKKESDKIVKLFECLLNKQHFVTIDVFKEFKEYNQMTLKEIKEQVKIMVLHCQKHTQYSNNQLARHDEKLKALDKANKIPIIVLTAISSILGILLTIKILLK